jgi:hypothetical protein
MRRIVVLVAVCISPLVDATCVGLVTAQQPANSLAAWKYPGAAQLASGSGAGGHFMVLATADGLEKVAVFYDKKLGGKKLSAPDRPGGSGLSGSDTGELGVFQDDSVQPGANAEARPVVVRIFVQRTKDHYLTFVLTRAKGEHQTHISLTRISK